MEWPGHSWMWNSHSKEMDVLRSPSRGSCSGRCYVFLWCSGNAAAAQGRTPPRPEWGCPLGLHGAGKLCSLYLWSVPVAPCRPQSQCSWKPVDRFHQNFYKTVQYFDFSKIIICLTVGRREETRDWNNRPRYYLLFWPCIQFDTVSSYLTLFPLFCLYSLFSILLKRLKMLGACAKKIIDWTCVVTIKLEEMSCNKPRFQAVILWLL